MHFLLNILLVIQILSALAMIGLILMQHGKGADMGAAFGSGASGSLFGASGSANFLSRSTAVLATIFFVVTLVLAYFGNLRGGAAGGSVLSGLPAAAQSASAPVPAPLASQVQPGSLVPGMSPASAEKADASLVQSRTSSKPAASASR